MDSYCKVDTDHLYARRIYENAYNSPQRIVSVNSRKGKYYQGNRLSSVLPFNLRRVSEIPDLFERGTVNGCPSRMWMLGYQLTKYPNKTFLIMYKLLLSALMDIFLFLYLRRNV